MRKKRSEPVYRLDAERVGKEAACELGDVRLERRMERIVGTMCKRPSASLPAMFPDESESEAVYRFLRNERLSLGRVLRGHVAHTVARAQSLRTVVVIHDTTEFSFATGRERRHGLQRHSEARQGFFGHVSLCVSADGARAPLGCLWMQPFVRLAHLDHEAERQDWQRLMGRDFSESGRWLKGIRHSERLLGPKVSAIHICDREGDSYPLLSKLVTDGIRFVVRLSHNRTLACPNLGHLQDFVGNQPLLGEPRTVELSERLHAEKRPSGQKSHPNRPRRMATLSIRRAEVTLRRPASRKDDERCPQTLTLNILDVREVNPPVGQAPVRWTLCTSESIDSAEDCWRIVDHYRTRWLVEEFFKALKTGCAFESRQLDSHKTLLIALGLSIPVAWTLLLMRYLEREAPDSPADSVLPRDLLGFLRRVWPRGPAPDHPTVRQALLAIASLGGHFRHNGPPGWLVLHRGYQTLLTMFQGFLAASSEGGCDQS